ncbi:MAG: hypothetical protein WC941_05850 [Candidatus Bathyarchaeia archaeon]
MSLKRTTVIFPKGGEEHTEETLRIAMEGAKERKIDTVIISTSTGGTGLKAIEVFKGSGLKLVFVRHQTGYPVKGKQMMPPDVKARLEKEGRVVTCTDVLTGGVDVGVGRQRPEKEQPQESSLPFIVPPVNVIIANTLRQISQGTKVGVEIAMMAADCDAVGIDKPVVSVGGSHAGADTAIVVTPAASNRFRDLRVHEFLAKPL